MAIYSSLLDFRILFAVETPLLFLLVQSIANLHPFKGCFKFKCTPSAALFLLLLLSSPHTEISVSPTASPLPEHCCQMRFICSSTIFISSLSSLKISPGLHNQVHSSLLEQEAVLIIISPVHSQISLFPNRNICPHHYFCLHFALA